MSGEKREAQKLFNELKELSTREYVTPYDMAILCAGLGERDQAFEYLDKAHEEHSPRLPYLRVEPIWDLLRDDPRFQDLLRRMNFPE